MSAPINKSIGILGIFILFLFVNVAPLLADNACPNGTDPIYCKIAKETGGKVFDGSSTKDWEEVLKEPPHLVEPKPVHEYSAFSKDIGCSEFSDTRARVICDSISKNLEWGWGGGHAMIAPGWKANWNTIRNVYCEQKISKEDLPVLEKMCGSKIESWMVCVKPTSQMDPRLSNGVTSIIQMVFARYPTPKELKGSIYDPKSNNYLLKEGCQK